jgi:MFS transporter, DHA2 family, multidrug resistance protein
MEAKTQAIIYPEGIERAILVTTAISCALLEIIDATVVNVSLREISGSIGATTAEIAWVVTAYSIANVIMIPLSGMLSVYVGRKAYFTFSVALFTLSSLMCGSSSSLWALVFWRFIQGIGGGGLLSTAQSIIVGAYPPEKIGTATAIFGLGVMLGPTFGPILGGYITDHLSWHWIFFINVPIGITASVLSWAYIPDLLGIVVPKKIDWMGIFFLITTIAPLQYFLEEGGSKDWFESAEITTLFLISMGSLVLFVWREWSIDYPAVNIKLYRNYNLAIGSALNLVLGVIMYGTMFIFPLFVQISLNWTATQTGAFMIPSALASAVGMMLVGRVFANKNPKILSISGVFITFIFLMMLSTASPDSTEQNFFFPFIIRGLGTAFMMMPILTMAMAGLSGKELAQATGLSSMMRQLGGAVGIAVMNVFLARQNAVVRAGMLSRVSEYSTLSNDRTNAFMQGFLQAGYSPDDATSMAYKVMENLLLKQELMVSYTHGFMNVGFLVLLCIPIILLVRYKKTVKTDDTKDEVNLAH